MASETNKHNLRASPCTWSSSSSSSSSFLCFVLCLCRPACLSVVCLFVVAIFVFVFVFVAAAALAALAALAAVAVAVAVAIAVAVAVAVAVGVVVVVLGGCWTKQCVVLYCMAFCCLVMYIILQRSVVYCLIMCHHRIGWTDWGSKTFLNYSRFRDSQLKACLTHSKAHWIAVPWSYPSGNQTWHCWKVIFSVTNLHLVWVLPNLPSLIIGGYIS